MNKLTWEGGREKEDGRERFLLEQRCRKWIIFFFSKLLLLLNVANLYIYKRGWEERGASGVLQKNSAADRTTKEQLDAGVKPDSLFLSLVGCEIQFYND